MSDRLKVEYVDIDSINPYPNNAKLHPAEQIEQIKKSIVEFGMNDPIGVWHDEVVEGHGRLIACKELNYGVVPIIRLDDLNEEQRRAYMLVHNQLTMNSGFDFELLDVELDNIDIDMEQFGFDLSVDSINSDDLEEEQRSLSDDFIIPPFDIFDARSRRWLDRKSMWNNKIGDMGQARADAKAYSIETVKSGTSILDPVLSEVVLRWFTPHDGSNCFDCFAGDTVFGYVSASLGHKFTGVELRQEQVDFNTERTKGLPCKYICGDGRNVAQYIAENSQDLLFSCPPYYDLEVYSDLENDASNQETYEEFYQILDVAFSESIKCLKDNRFAVVVCGDIRDKKGAYYNFPNDIINTFLHNGMQLYNNIKLLTPLGTAQIRARRYMEYRKTVHVYQDVLIFYKGDAKLIKKEFPRIEVADVSEDMEL